MKRALVLGGYGGFGARLSRRLAGDGWEVLVAGRDGAKAEALAATLTGARGVVADRDGDLAALLADAAPLLLIDAAGPFQGSDYRVVEACIAAGVHYLDLADAREFVCGIDALDEAALAKGVAVISGCSSVPALSGAVVRELARGMDRVTSVAMSISASNRATAGRSVAAAILSYAGRVIPLWRGGRWERGFGLQGLARTDYAIRGERRLRRLVALADVPDLALLPQRLPGHPAAIFRAGPEFGFQLWGLWLLSWPVRWGWVASLSRFARALLPLQSLAARLGSDRSAMQVEVKGVVGDRLTLARWTLLAERGDGPEIPTLAAQLLARAVAEGSLAPGARDAGEQLTLPAFRTLFADLAIKEESVRADYAPVYARVMGTAFEQLPPAVRHMHEIVGTSGATGEAVVERGRSWPARLVAAVMRFPPAGTHDLHVLFEEEQGRERWTRDFGGRRFASVLSERRGDLIERFGPLRFRFDLPADGQGLLMAMKGWSAFGVPLPLALAPRSPAREWEADGRFHFDVPIALPLIGTVVHYRGWLNAPGAFPSP